MNLSSVVNAVNASDYRIDRKMVWYGGASYGFRDYIVQNSQGCLPDPYPFRFFYKMADPKTPEDEDKNLVISHNNPDIVDNIKTNRPNHLWNGIEWKLHSYQASDGTDRVYVRDIIEQEKQYAQFWAEQHRLAEENTLWKRTQRKIDRMKEIAKMKYVSGLLKVLAVTMGSIIIVALGLIISDMIA